MLRTPLAVLVLLPSLASAQEQGTCSQDVPSPLQSLSVAAQAGAFAPCGGPKALGPVLAQAVKTSEGKQAIVGLITEVARQSGQTITSDQLDAMIADPASIERLLTVSLPEVSAGLQKVQAAHSSTPKASDWKLPSTVRLAEAAGYFDGNVEGPKPIASGLLLKGDPSAGLPAAEVQERRALAEILDRLADNDGRSRPAFRVIYRGRAYSTLGGFLTALQRNGNTVTGTVVQRVANFIDLRAPNPDGSSCPILATVMIRTGYRTADGKPIDVPGVHSAVRFDISGPDLSASVDYYQGTDGTGFFPSGLNQERDYLGHQESDVFTGPNAVRAAELGGLWRGVVDGIAREKGLLAGGYGQTGVCNDSVALIQQVLTGRTTIYPLAMDHSLVDAYLDQKIAQGGRLSPAYRELDAAVDAIPADTTANPSQPARILDSLPFPAGPNPVYPGVQEARDSFGAGG